MSRYRYTVEVTRVDHGAYSVGFDQRKDAIAAAYQLAFACGGLDRMLVARHTIRDIRNADCMRASYEPSCKSWSVTIRKHPR